MELAGLGSCVLASRRSRARPTVHQQPSRAVHAVTADAGSAHRTGAPPKKAKEVRMTTPPAFNNSMPLYQPYALLATHSMAAARVREGVRVFLVAPAPLILLA